MDPVAVLASVPAILLYMLPTIWAYHKRHRWRQWIALINIFFGVTIIGWIIAFAWASAADYAPSQVEPQFGAPSRERPDTDAGGLQVQRPELCDPGLHR